MRGICAIAIAAAAGTAANADFEIIDQFVLNTSAGQAHGITTDGTNWYVAQIFGPDWDVFDADFNYLSTTNVAVGNQFRGISFCEDSGTMFAADYGDSVTRECQLDGTQIDEFPTFLGGGINAIAVHRLDNTLWYATFNDGVYQYDKDGNQLAVFFPPFQITGLAIDEAADTLLLMESNADLVYEYDFDGNQVGTPIATDMIPDNGQGLYYDAYTANLYATTQTGPSQLTIFNDPDRETLGGDCPADCNGDGQYSILDFVCYQELFSDGCD